MIALLALTGKPATLALKELTFRAEFGGQGPALVYAKILYLIHSRTMRVA